MNVVGSETSCIGKLHTLLGAACCKGMKLHGRVVKEQGAESSLGGSLWDEAGGGGNGTTLAQN
jgi:hypothetical protein